MRRVTPHPICTIVIPSTVYKLKLNDKHSTRRWLYNMLIIINPTFAYGHVSCLKQTLHAPWRRLGRPDNCQSWCRTQHTRSWRPRWTPNSSEHVERRCARGGVVLCRLGACVGVSVGVWRHKSGTAMFFHVSIWIFPSLTLLLNSPLHFSFTSPFIIRTPIFRYLSIMKSSSIHAISAPILWRLWKRNSSLKWRVLVQESESASTVYNIQCRLT